MPSAAVDFKWAVWTEVLKAWKAPGENLYEYHTRWKNLDGKPKLPQGLNRLQKNSPGNVFCNKGTTSGFEKTRFAGCFVTGHDFSRAATRRKINAGFSPCYVRVVGFRSMLCKARNPSAAQRHG